MSLTDQIRTIKTKRGRPPKMTPDMLAFAASHRRVGVRWKEIGALLGMYPQHVSRLVCAAHPELRQRRRAK